MVMIQNNLKNEAIIEGPAVAVDTIILAMSDDSLRVLLVKIKSGPYKDKWALPGGLVRIDESLDETAKRIMSQKVGNKDLKMEQLYCFGEPKRDIRGRSVSVAYLGLVRDVDQINPKLTDYYEAIDWFEIDNLPIMAFDHKDMIGFTREELKNMVDRKEIIQPLLPDKFSLSELQKVQETMLGKKLDKRNFVKKILAEEKVVQTKEIRAGQAHRPARLFKFR